MIVDLKINTIRIKKGIFQKLALSFIWKKLILEKEKAVGMHESQLHGGKKSNLAKLKSGGMTKMKAGGSCYVKGGGIEKKGKTKGKMC